MGYYQAAEDRSGAVGIESQLARLAERVDDLRARLERAEERGEEQRRETQRWRAEQERKRLDEEQRRSDERFENTLSQMRALPRPGGYSERRPAPPTGYLEMCNWVLLGAALMLVLIAVFLKAGIIGSG